MLESQDLSSSVDIPGLSVGIVNHNSASRCLKLIDSLFDELQILGAEILIVDNASMPLDLDRLRTGVAELLERGLQVYLEASPENRLATARNWIVDHSLSSQLLMLDPDAELPQGWIQRALQFYTSSQLIDRKLLGLSGPGIIPQDEGPWAEALHQVQKFYWMNLGSPQNSPQVVATTRLDHLPCTAILYSVENLRELGGFTNSLQRAGEDLELGLRARQSGFRFEQVQELRYLHRTQMQSLSSWAKRVWRMGLGRSEVLKLHPKQLMKPSHAISLALPVLFLLSLWIPTLTLFLILAYAVFLFFSYRKLRRPAVAMILTVVTHVSYSLSQWVGLFKRSGKAESKTQSKTQSKTMLPFHCDIFSHGQVHSKMHLCEKLENLGRPVRSIYILAGWAGLMSFMIHTRAKLKFEKIILIDKDPAACQMARVLNNALECESRFEVRCQDVGLYALEDLLPGDLVINTSVEHFSDFRWWQKIPKGVLCALQASDLVHFEHICHVADLASFKEDVLNLPKHPITYFEDTLKIEYPNQSFQRFTWIGPKP